MAERIVGKRRPLAGAQSTPKSSADQEEALRRSLAALGVDHRPVEQKAKPSLVEIVQQQMALAPHPTGPAPSVDEQILEGLDDDDAEVPVAPSMIVVESVGAAETAGGKRVMTEYQGLVGQSVPLTTIPSDLASVRAQLLADAPHAGPVLDLLLTDLARRAAVGQETVRWRPTIVVGGPGSGKSTLLRAIAAGVGAYSESMSVASEHDDLLLGLNRGWSSGSPSIVVEAFRRGQRANPILILDEIDKVHRSPSGGYLLDRLLGLLEPGEAKAWTDPYLQAPIDASAVSWLMTANSLKTIPRPFLSRCRVIKMPTPGLEHIGAIAERIIDRLAHEQGLDRGWHPPLTGYEIGLLQRSWPEHKDLRVLGRQVEAVLDSRNLPSC